MSDARNTESSGSAQKDPSYPTNNYLALLDGVEHVASAVAALESGGFLTSEIRVTCGAKAADVLEASSGRRGLRGLAIRIGESIGYTNVEVRVKERAEQALRDGQYVLLVAAHDDQRRAAAERILRENGASEIFYMGRFTVDVVQGTAID
jgi:hypothetical protein